MQSVRFDGVDLAYEVVGSGDPVVFIHGAMIADSFRPLLNDTSLTAHHRLVLYHRPGYGQSSAGGLPATVEQQSRACAALLRHLGIERAHVTGHSYGGSIALQLAHDHADMIQTLTLLEPAMIVGASGGEYRRSLIAGQETFEREGAERVVSEFLEARTPGFRQLLDPAIPGAYEQALTDARTAFDSDLPALIDWNFGEAESRRIKIPTFSIVGEVSVSLSPRFAEVGQLLQTWIPQLVAFVLPGATHFPQIENPRGLSDALQTFWQRYPISGSTQHA